MGGRKKKAVKTNLAKAKANRAAKKKKKAEVEKMADEALRRIEDLPQELKIQILHHLSITTIQKLNLPSSMLRSVLQARESTGSQELVKSTWMPRMLTTSDTLALMKMAEEADLVPRCPVIKPSIYNHPCSILCPWFGPPKGWNKYFERNHRTYAGQNDSDDESYFDSDDEDLLPDEGESNSSFEFTEDLLFLP